MGLFNQFPFTNFDRTNLDYILKKVAELDSSMTEFIKQNVIKYADPLLWDITSQYEANTVVVDTDETAYLSVQPVPLGVSISNTDYWTAIGSFAGLWGTIKDAVSVVDCGSTGNVPSDVAKGGLFWYNDILYEALTDMTAGTAVIEGTNAKVTDVSDRILEAISDEVLDRNAAIAVEEGARIAADDAITNTITNGFTTDHIEVINYLKYGSPEKLNDYFDGVDAVDSSGNAYKLLVPGSGINNLGQENRTAVWNPAYFYVNQTTGSDTNAGTAIAPFKTLEKAFSMAMQGYTDLRIYLTGAGAGGTYTLPWSDYSFPVLHLSNLSGEEVIIQFSADADIAIYSSHWNVNNVTLRPSSTAHQIYFENCAGGFTNCIFEDFRRVRAYGGCLTLVSCSFNKVDFVWANGEINNCIILNTDKDVTPILIDDASNVRIRGTFQCTNLSDTGTVPLIQVSRAVCWFQNQFTAVPGNTNLYAYAFQVNLGALFIPSNILATYTRVAAANYTNTNAGFICTTPTVL